MDDDIVRTEIYCHECGNYVQFALNLGISGRHTLNCPICGHEHYRVVRDGRVSEERWQSSSQLPIVQVSTGTITASANSIYDCSTIIYQTGGTVSATWSCSTY